MMTDTITEPLSKLQEVLRDYEDIALAVSGGVDSMTLASVANQTPNLNIEIFHALSPAVPYEATARVRSYADQESWKLREIDAGEFSDPNYRNNPVNRCFYCKSHLYKKISTYTESPILSGTNLDDLGDYRPGLEAANRHNVRHPFVEAEIDKTTIREIARHLKLNDLADLPAAPCLSSRVETGIMIDGNQLELINSVENFVSNRIAAYTVRCRIRRKEIVIELDTQKLQSLNMTLKNELRTVISAMFEASGIIKPLDFRSYRMGSAFLHKKDNA